MKNYKYILYLLLSLLVMTGCSKDDGTAEDARTRRTIMVYFNAENNLYEAASEDLKEIVTGSRNLPSDCNLLVFYDVLTKPVIYSVKNGEKVAVKTYETDIDASDADNMLSVFQTMIALSPSDEYATVFWGHGDGPVIENGTSSANSLDVEFTESSSNEPNSYGADYNSNSASRSTGVTWIDLPVLANVMKQLPKQEFIFFDACCMQSIEVAYELRNCTKYFIAAPCETPSFGAPYASTVSRMCLSNPEEAAKAIAADYTSDNNKWEAVVGSTGYKVSDIFGRGGMTVVKTENIAALLQATNKALKTISASSSPLELTFSFPADSHDATSCIYYLKTAGSRWGMPVLYDMNDVMLHNLSSEAYSEWKAAFDDVVIYNPAPKDIRDTDVCSWFGGDNISIFGTTLPMMSKKNFSSFYISSDTYGGVSMYVPNNLFNYYTTPNMNTRMYDYEWCKQVGWKDLGW